MSKEVGALERSMKSVRDERRLVQEWIASRRTWKVLYYLQCLGSEAKAGANVSEAYSVREKGGKTDMS